MGPRLLRHTDHTTRRSPAPQPIAAPYRARKRAGRLSNFGAPRPPRLPRTTSPTTNPEPADSRIERANQGERVNLIVARESLFQIDNPDLPMRRYRSTIYRDIRACDAEFFPRGGWRVLQPPTSALANDVFIQGKKLTRETIRD